MDGARADHKQIQRRISRGGGLCNPAYASFVLTSNNQYEDRGADHALYVHPSESHIMWL